MSWSLDTGVVEPVAAWLGTYCLHGIALFVLAALVARVVRSARVREQLWRAALFGPLVTASLQLGAGVDPLAGRWLLPGEDLAATRSAQERASETLAMDTFRAVPGAREPWPTLAAMDTPFGPRVDEVARATAPPSGSGAGDVIRRRWQLVASILVILGIAALMLRALLEGIRMRRLGDRVPADHPGLLSDVESLCRKAGVRRRVRVEITGEGASAYATGVFAPTVVVPAHALGALDPASLRAMLAHEIGHLARLDPLWAAAIRSVTSLFFFQPLNWIAARKLDECAEFCCDEFAVDATGDEVALARCLATVAEWIVGPDEGLLARPACTMAHAGSPLAERVERILATDGQETRVGAATRWLGAAAVGATALAAPGFAVAVPAAVPSPLPWPHAPATSGGPPEAVVLALKAVDVSATSTMPDVFEELTRSTEALQAEIQVLLRLCEEREVEPATIARLELLRTRCDRLTEIATRFQRQALSRLTGR